MIIARLYQEQPRKAIQRGEMLNTILFSACLLVCLFVCLFVCWLVGWLVVWLVGWLVCLFVALNSYGDVLEKFFLSIYGTDGEGLGNFLEHEYFFLTLGCA